MKTVAKASAPASIGNVGPGFDILGQAFEALQDVVTARREEKPGVRLGSVTGRLKSLPPQPERNTALAAASALLEAAGAKFGVTLDIEKGVPLSAGMGGSAASAVAAAVAVNGLLEKPFAHEDLLMYALEGERVSSDPPPWDNVMASLLGGLVIAARLEPGQVRRIPAPSGIVSIIAHPDAEIETRAARGILRPTIPMETVVDHSRRLAAFVAGCAANDHELIKAGLDDVLVEPQRRYLLPALPAVKAAALQAGALGCSFSGSGPSIFAWCAEGDREQVEAAMRDAFAAEGQTAQTYHAPIRSRGARLEPVAEAVG
ncbi:MAG: homoserine kinase [Caulobacterales bacterium]|uniref:homoserine kinase n=1 Tax=Glycocaulis sp. TaxID=1969725 RepID=UPI003F9FB276